MLTVITPAESHRLTTVAAVRRDLVTIGGLVTDDIVSALIDQVSAAIEAWCGYPFGLETVEEEIWSNDPFSARLLLTRWPIQSVASVLRRGDAVDPSTFRVDTNGALVALGVSGWGRNDTVVTYTAGYVLPSDDADAPAPTLPPDVQRAAIIATKEACFAVGRDPALKADQVSGIGSVQYAVNTMSAGSAFRPDVEGLLNRYRIPVLG